MKYVAVAALLAIAIFFAFVAPASSDPRLPPYPTLDAKVGVWTALAAVVLAFIAGALL